MRLAVVMPDTELDQAQGAQEQSLQTVDAAQDEDCPETGPAGRLIAEESRVNRSTPVSKAIPATPERRLPNLESSSAASQMGRPIVDAVGRAAAAHGKVHSTVDALAG